MKYSEINKSFKKYKLQKKKESMNKICKPTQFKLQPQQLFLRDLFKTKKIKGLLVYHKIGAGKTCTAISIAEEFKKKMNIIVVLPAALIGNFEDELRSKCGNNNYISGDESYDLKNLSVRSKKYKKIIKTSKKKIKKFYKIYSYHKFIDLINNSKIRLKNTLLIVDEIQNMISESGIFYQKLSKIVEKSDNRTRIILLSGTPIFNKPVEIALMLNLLKKTNKIPIGQNFNDEFLEKFKTKDGISYKIKNKKKLEEHFYGLISYYSGASPIAFPKANLKIVKCKMSTFQYKSYITSLSSSKNYLKGSFRDVDLLKLPSDFLIGPRFISNVSFPNKSIGNKGFKSFKGKHLSLMKIKKYSIKFYKIYKKIQQSKGPIFIYSNFKELGGLKSLIVFLEYQGYKSYKNYGEGKNRYAIWSGDERINLKENIKNTFNNKRNSEGNLIKIILGSPSIKEGVSLLRVSQVHILEPYWNMARLKQVIGRAIRFCSHKDLPKDRRKVDIFLYLATYEKEITADKILWNMAKRKQQLINSFEGIMKNMAIDCKLFYLKNKSKKDRIKCY